MAAAATDAALPASPDPSSPPPPPPVEHASSTVEPHGDAARESTHLESTDEANSSEGAGLPVSPPHSEGTVQALATGEQEEKGGEPQEAVQQELLERRDAAHDPLIVEPEQEDGFGDQTVTTTASSNNSSLLPPPSPNPYGEPTPPSRTAELPISPLAVSTSLPEPASTPSPELVTAVPATPTSPPQLQLKTHPADLVSLSNPDPHGPSVPSTPISPSGGDAGHDDEVEENGRGSLPSFDVRPAAVDDGNGEKDVEPSVEESSLEKRDNRSYGAVRSTDYGRMNGHAAQQSDDSDTVEALHPAALARGPSTSSPRQSPASQYTAGTLPPFSSEASPSRAAYHGRSQSIAVPQTTPPPPSFRDRKLDRSPSARIPSSPTPAERVRASSTAPNGLASDPATSLSREASQRTRTGSQPPSRQPSISTNGGGGGSMSRRDGRDGKGRERERSGDLAPQGSVSSRSRRTLGEWQMTKTLGAGSMGKVKLGVSTVTGEKVAIKIIPRFTSTAAAQRQAEQSQQAQHAAAVAPTDPHATAAAKKSEPTGSFLQKAAAKDASKEVRTVREGSLSLLLHHPYICGMREMLVYPHHYYFVQEYINGGQMLDYIISHGRLRERSARKFARQIGSALEYCHANSIVHRDLKIENILISKTGNIKIIDFGLSNLYSPVSHLSTFCGSLYFAAPELLNAKPYTGPEVDVWSFGIVLYVLVCGKVPFDDQSMPALHAKIKRGQVEYPTWLSSECKHLLSRMLVTVPAQRATLTEVLNHPWILKGFTSPPDPHIPARAPLRFGELDEEVIRGMTGFEFGTEEEIAAKLGDVIQSDLYRQAVRNWEARRSTFGSGAGDASDSDKERPAMRVDGKDMKRASTKRFSGLGFYGKKLAGGFNAAFAGTSAPPSRNADNDPFANISPDMNVPYPTNGAAPRPDQLDPTRGFHPLISIYYLVKEKIERERIYGPGVFASSTLSLTGPPPPPAPAQAYQTGANIVAPPVNVDVRPAMPTPPVPLTPQPRQRATGEEFGAIPATAPPRANDFGSTSSNKRTSYFGTSPTPGSPAMSSFRPQGEYEAPSSPTPRERKSSNRMSMLLGSSAADRERERLAEQQAAIAAAGDDVPLASVASPSSPGGFARRFSSLLGRSSPEGGYKGHRQRASIATSGHKSTTKTAASPLPQVSEGSPSSTLRPPATPTPGRLPSSGSDVPLASPPDGKPVVRASTVGEISPSRHQRGATIAAAASPLSQSVATGDVATIGRAGGAFLERQRQASLGAKPPRPKTSNDIAGMFSEVEEEELADHADAQAGAGASPESPTNTRPHVGFIGRTSSGSSGKDAEKSESAKPVWLKGLFSVSTTSTKPIATLRADLVKVLDRLGVQHRDVKNGFECAHVPSIVLGASTGATGSASISPGAKDKGVRETLKRRASKLLLSHKDGEKQPSSPGGAGEDSQTSLPMSSLDPRGDRASSSSFHTPLSHSVQGDAGSRPGTAGTVQPSTQQPPASRFDPLASTSTSQNKSDMIVRFEIFLVKMPLLPGIHGLQFRRIGGDAWQYQMLARRVLQEMKL
ncbi:Serine/threonine-protein kinase [Rhodotorula toruloides]|uniref:non-specific serine/threonine protein kinase n=2 Tax=Rhodotorula toruloides TaxID=5286 RepID=A0A2T0A4M3_RHOTO|nr:hypothetical protein AAT19DRAFT_16810 [Rhodotorula toruloides]